MRSSLKIFLLLSFIAGFQLFSSGEELKDLSADAAYTFKPLNGIDPLYYVEKNESVNKDFLLKDNPSNPNQKYAFRTIFNSRSGGAPSPYIIINLAKMSDIRKIYIQNRQDNNLKTAEGLTVWISKDQNVWKRIWEAKECDKDWTIELPKGESGQFIMIGIDREKGILCLNKVRIYGNVL